MGGAVTNHTFGPQVEAGIRPVRWGFSIGRGAPKMHACSPTVDRGTALRALAAVAGGGLDGALDVLGADVREWVEARTQEERHELYEALREQVRAL